MNAGVGPVDCASSPTNYPDTQDKYTCHVCLSTGAVVGLSFHSQVGLVSLVSLMVLVGIITRKYWCLPKGQRKLFRGNIDILMANLIMADIVMSLGAVSDVYWAHRRQVYCGSYCNAQGALRTIGTSSASLSTLAVAIYTFMAIYRVRRPTYRPRVCLAGVIATWLWAILWAVVPIGPRGDAGLDKEGNVNNYYTPTPWWCWINGKYTAERVVATYLWLWMAGIGSIVLYVPAYLMVRKQQVALEPDELRQLPTIEVAREPQQTENPEEPEGPKQPSEPDARSVASSVYQSNDAAKLLYPFVYTLCVLPWSIIRWTGFVNSDILKSPNILAPYMLFFGIFNLMGFFNVLLILLTRPTVLLLGTNEESGAGDPRAASTENIQLRVSRTVAGQENVGGGQQRGVGADETHTGQRRSANHFGGADVALTREF